MKVHDAMKTGVQITSPDQSIAEAAKMMARIDAGVLPVGENDRLVGMITDRDMAVRAIAMGKGPDTLVRDVMSKEVCYCYEDQDIDNVAANMADIKVRRLPVVNRDKRLVGILSLGDIARSDGLDDASAMALSSISQPGGEHSQFTEGGSRRLTRSVG